jgi:hypothetical protein
VQRRAILSWLALGAASCVPKTAPRAGANGESDELRVLPEHIRFIRALQAVWAYDEAGAPALALSPNDSGYEAILRRVTELRGGPAVSRYELVAYYRHSMFAAEAFLSNAVLPAGSYSYRNALSPVLLQEQPFAREKLCAIDGDDVSVEVHAEHLALLKRMNVRMGDDGGLDMGPGVDGKRPYGGRSYYYGDMAEALHLELEGAVRDDDAHSRDFTEEQKHRLDRLHREMQPVLQILLANGELRPTRFRRLQTLPVPNLRHIHYGPWTPV